MKWNFVVGVLLLAGWAPAADTGRVIEMPNATLYLATRTGDLVGLKWKSPTLEVIKEARLGENFRLVLPKAGAEAATFNSREQQVSRVEPSADGVVCYYDSLRNAEETLPVKVEYSIRAVGDQLQFSIKVDNPTERKLAEVYYGILGGMQGIGDRLSTETLIPGEFDEMNGGARNEWQPLFRALPPGYSLGTRYATNAYQYPRAMTMGWMEAYNPKANIGLYYANQDPETRLSALYIEVRPFIKNAVVGDNWPTEKDVPPGEPIGLTMGWVNFPFSKGAFRSGPLALQVHSGDWHRGSEIYRTWFDQHFHVEHPPTWLRKEMAWQSVELLNSEDVITHRFKDLPKLAADAKKYGVTTFEILGWNVGGWDRGYPQYWPDPRLGTREEFRGALAEMRRMGVHPLLFANIQVADTATPLFKEELKRYAVDGRWADDWAIFGFGQGTIGARMGLARANRSMVCSGMTLVSPAHPEFRKLLMDQYLQLVRDGVDALHLDKAGEVEWLDFNPRLPVSADKSLIGGVIDTFRELESEARKINPNFALASEIGMDRTFPYVDMRYHNASKDVALLYTFPEWTSTIDSEDPGDFNVMNDGMRYGLVWHLAARHYFDSIDEPLTRPLARYVSELIRIRTKYEDMLFQGRFKDTLGAEVKMGPDMGYSVFEPMEASSGSRACVVVNYGNEQESAEVALPGREGREVEISAPFQSDRKTTLPARVTVPAQRVVVIISR